jgi:hypothetical protein
MLTVVIRLKEDGRRAFAVNAREVFPRSRFGLVYFCGNLQIKQPHHMCLIRRGWFQLVD